ncbi:hypothetical protein G9A89_022512 [Geosiphon pyriformis]|nr:hypothetical protein G9A89_022512 [Geosiphon pyriformis]
MSKTIRKAILLKTFISLSEVPRSISFGAVDSTSPTISITPTVFEPTTEAEQQEITIQLGSKLDYKIINPIRQHRPILMSAGFNQRTRFRRDFSRCSQEELLEMLERNSSLMKNSLVISNLPDKGQRLHDTNARLLQALQKFEANDLENLMVDSEGGIDGHIYDNVLLSNSNVSQIGSLSASKINVFVGPTDDKLLMEDKSVNELQAKLSRMEMMETKVLKTDSNEIHRSSLFLANGTSIKDYPPRRVGKYLQPVRLKTISINQAAELEERQRRLQEQTTLKEAAEKLKKTKIPVVSAPGFGHAVNPPYSEDGSEDDDDDDDEWDDDEYESDGHVGSNDGVDREMDYEEDNQGGLYASDHYPVETANAPREFRSTSQR